MINRAIRERHEEKLIVLAGAVAFFCLTSLVSAIELEKRTVMISFRNFYANRTHAGVPRVCLGKYRDENKVI